MLGSDSFVANELYVRKTFPETLMFGYLVTKFVPLTSRFSITVFTRTHSWSLFQAHLNLIHTFLSLYSFSQSEEVYKTNETIVL